MMKRVGTCVYVHRSNERELFDSIKDLETRELVKYSVVIHDNIGYSIIKYDRKKETLSFIYCDDWDTANEPTVGDSYIYNIRTREQKFKEARKNNKQIYHHKWMFVSDSYTGFDIEKSKERSRTWEKIQNLNKSKIGNKDYWNSILDLNGIEI